MIVSSTCAARCRRVAAAFLALALVLIVCPRAAQSQASLAAEDIIDEVPVKLGNVTDRFTVIRDALRPEQWYYAPSQPRLSERVMSNGQREPEFALVRYQFKDPADPEKLAEGGFLQFAMTLALPPEALPQLGRRSPRGPTRSRRPFAWPRCPSRRRPRTCTCRSRAPHRLRARGPRHCSDVLHAEDGVRDVPQQDRLRRLRHARQRDDRPRGRHRVHLHGVDAAGRLHGDRGLGFGVHLLQQGREDSRAARLGSLFGGKAQIDRNKLVETLKQNKVIEIDEIDNPDNGAKYLEMILNRINNELLEAMKPPDKVPEAVAGDPTPDKSILDKLTGKFLRQADTRSRSRTARS